MILSPEIKSDNADNEFCKAYSALNYNDKARIREAIVVSCDITESTFYNWVKHPELVSCKLHRRYIAYLMFNKTVKEFFGK